MTGNAPASVKACAKPPPGLSATMRIGPCSDMANALLELRKPQSTQPPLTPRQRTSSAVGSWRRDREGIGHQRIDAELGQRSETHVGGRAGPGQMPAEPRCGRPARRAARNMKAASTLAWTRRHQTRPVVKFAVACRRTMLPRRQAGPYLPVSPCHFEHGKLWRRLPLASVPCRRRCRATLLGPVRRDSRVAKPLAAHGASVRLGVKSRGSRYRPAPCDHDGLVRRSAKGNIGVITHHLKRSFRRAKTRI